MDGEGGRRRVAGWPAVGRAGRRVGPRVGAWGRGSARGGRGCGVVDAGLVQGPRRGVRPGILHKKHDDGDLPSTTKQETFDPGVDRL